jgi:hypothetical protein
VRRDPAGARLARDAGDNLHALDQQVLQPVVDPVDASTQVFEIGRSIGHGFDRCRNGR